MLKNGIFSKTTQTFALLFFITLITTTAQTIHIPDGWTDQYVYANGIRIHYYHAIPQKDKPVIVMVHGITDIGLNWTTLTLKLQDNYNIYMLDARGHGLSDPFTQNDDEMTLVKDVVSFIDVMKLEKPIIMGHSMGAATVMVLGAEYPDIAKAVIMLDPLLQEKDLDKIIEWANKGFEYEPDKKYPPNQLPVSMLGSPEKLVAQNNFNFDDLVKTCQRQSPKWDLLDCKYWALSKKQYHGAYSEKTWKVMGNVMRTKDALSKITAHVLILKADASEEVRKENLKIAEVIQNGKLVHINDSGHNLHHDQLEQTVKVLNEFLSTL